MTKNDNKYARKLLDRYNEGNCTPEEESQVEAWFNAYANTLADLKHSEDIKHIGQEIWEKLPKTSSPLKRKMWPSIAAAAAVVLVLIGLFKLYGPDPYLEQRLSQNKKDNISPGTFGATLTLANGKHIKLSLLRNGVFAKEAGVRITKTAKGELVYKVGDEASNVLNTNTLATATGETFKVELPDGSFVWLNAASSLTYSTNLATAEVRKVKLSGEAYFKVAHDSEHPFIVTTLGHDIRVLGTEFNVSSYGNDDAEVTTLVQGKISMNTAMDKAILAPGEKGTVRNGSITKAPANIEAATGWKNNEFVFASQDISSIMKLIARWYDVKIIYEGDIPSEKISGSISRFADIHSVLNILQATGTVKIKTAGKRIMVSAM